MFEHLEDFRVPQGHKENILEMFTIKSGNKPKFRDKNFDREELQTFKPNSPGAVSFTLWSPTK